VDCSNALFILTSNMQPEARVGFGDAAADFRAAALQHLRPELVNRITEVIGFATLGRTELARILDLLLIETAASFQETHRRVLTVDASVREQIVGDAFEPRQGARPLERAVETRLMKPLADAIFRGELPSEAVHASLRDGRVTFLSGE
jgi:ATP-dependent Clp protease ATP-binding subunit ClpA